MQEQRRRHDGTPVDEHMTPLWALRLTDTVNQIAIQHNLEPSEPGQDDYRAWLGAVSEALGTHRNHATFIDDSVRNVVHRMELAERMLPAWRARCENAEQRERELKDALQAADAAVDEWIDSSSDKANENLVDDLHRIISSALALERTREENGEYLTRHAEWCRAGKVVLRGPCTCGYRP